MSIITSMHIPMVTSISTDTSTPTPTTMLMVTRMRITCHRTLTEIDALIDRSALSAAGKSKAKELFQQLGVAEAAIHGTTLDKVHLHEVGALDSIIDIVGAVYAIESLGVDRVVASPLNVGSGSDPLGARAVSGSRAGDAATAAGRADLFRAAAG